MQGERELAELPHLDSDLRDIHTTELQAMRCLLRAASKKRRRLPDEIERLKNFNNNDTKDDELGKQSFKGR